MTLNLILDSISRFDAGSVRQDEHDVICDKVTVRLDPYGQDFIIIDTEMVGTQPHVRIQHNDSQPVLYPIREP